MKLIISYYGQSFWGGGTYAKLTRQENEDYRTEYMRCIRRPNSVPGAEIYMRSFERIQFQDKRGFSLVEDNDPRLVCKSWPQNEKFQQFVDSVLQLDLEKISKEEYWDNDFLDGLVWFFFVQIDDRQYYMQGYVKMPPAIEKSIHTLCELLAPEEDG